MANFKFIDDENLIIKIPTTVKDDLEKWEAGGGLPMYGLK
jgi:hypothetical protein